MSSFEEVLYYRFTCHHCIECVDIPHKADPPQWEMTLSSPYQTRLTCPKCLEVSTFKDGTIADQVRRRIVFRITKKY